VLNAFDQGSLCGQFATYYRTKFPCEGQPRLADRLPHTFLALHHTAVWLFCPLTPSSSISSPLVPLFPCYLPLVLLGLCKEAG